MFSPLLALALLAPPQAPSATLLAQRLVQAETAHNHAAVLDLLTQFTDVLPNAPAETLAGTIPPLVQATSDPDPHARTLALLALTTRTGPDALSLLQPFLPTLTPHLQDPAPTVRELTALLLGGFAPHPTPAVILPLLTTLSKAKHPTETDLSVIVALLTVTAGPTPNPQVAPTILSFLHRPDLPEALTARILSAIANHRHHLAALDTGLLTFLEPSHPAALRATLIGLLPHLALSGPDYEAIRRRLKDILASPVEDPAINAAAAEVLPCWTGPHMADTCPSPAVHYRMVPKPALPTPR